jgi:NADPH:quinone reductase-like Zn-dependent oxidoreductase
MPEPGPGQIMTRSRAAVSPIDDKARARRPAAGLPGAMRGRWLQAVGTVDALGPAVTVVATGDKIAAMLRAPLDAAQAH